MVRVVPCLLWWLGAAGVLASDLAWGGPVTSGNQAGATADGGDVTLESDSDRAIAWQGGFLETAANDGSVEGRVTATLTGDTFIANPWWFSDALNNVPAGLEPRWERTSATVVTLWLTGRANAHADADDVNDVTVRFGESSYNGFAEPVRDSAKTDIAIDFHDPAAPPTPSAPTFGTATQTGLVLLWTAPTFGLPGKAASTVQRPEPLPEVRTPGLQYDLQFRAAGMGGFEDGPQDVTATTVLLSGLAPNTGYEVRVRATNSDGNSAWSGPATAMTLPEPEPIEAGRFELFADGEGLALPLVEMVEDWHGPATSYEFAVETFNPSLAVVEILDGRLMIEPNDRGTDGVSGILVKGTERATGAVVLLHVLADVLPPEWMYRRTLRRLLPTLENAGEG